jgi:hypothetical protein
MSVNEIQSKNKIICLSRAGGDYFPHCICVPVVPGNFPLAFNIGNAGVNTRGVIQKHCRSDSP